MANVTVQIVLSSAQTRLQKGLIRRVQNKMTHFRYRDWVGSGSGISTDCHLYYVEQRRAWFGIYHPASLPQKLRKNDLNNRQGDFCESGIRACPESVGVGKFCRLRLRLRLREKQPTPTPTPAPTPTPQPWLQHFPLTLVCDQYRQSMISVVTLTSFTADLSRACLFLSPQGVKLIREMVLKV